jgi:hypothetical protein
VNIHLETAEILEEAANYLAEHGHTKHALMDDEGRVCAVGALRMVTGSMYGSAPLYPSVIAVAADLGVDLDNDPIGYSAEGRAWNNVVKWNNAPERTGEEVIDQFLLTAAALRAHATPKPESEVLVNA